MRIGIDGRELCGRVTGVGRYLQGLLDAWSRLPSAARHEFVVYTCCALHPSPADYLRCHVISGLNGTVWEQVRVPLQARRDRLDLFFAPGYTAPLLLGCPYVVTVHDVSFAAHPEWFRGREGIRRRWVTRLAARHARLVLTDSSFGKTELVKYLNVRDDRVRVISPGLRMRAQKATPREPLVLFVGSIFNRRRLPDLIRAFALVARRRPPVRLTIVGDDRTYPTQDLRAVAEHEGVADRVSVRPYAAEVELDELFSRASVFAFLSEYEGFGFTPLEALAAGVPIVVGDTRVAREVYDGAARYVPIADVTACAVALEALLFDEAARVDLLTNAPAVLSRYGWDRAAAQTLAAFEAAAG